MLQLVMLTLLLCSCRAPSPAQPQPSPESDDIGTRVQRLDSKLLDSGYVKKVSNSEVAILVDGGHDKALKELESQLPEGTEKGWADYAGGASATIFRIDQLELTVESEQACESHTLVEVNRL
jgi:hypothetical protein